MRIESLPSPGVLRRAHELRTLCASVISTVETVSAVTPGNRIDTALHLRDFFLACAAELEPYVPTEEVTDGPV